MTAQSVTHHEHHHNSDAKDIFGFWIYIMSDCVLFCCLFATFMVLRNNTFGGVGMKQITDIPYVFAETLFLLTSSFTYGMAILNMYRNKRNGVIAWLIVTFLLGATFVGLELNEFIHLAMAGHTWQSSAALSSFFALVGTHGLHVSLGLLWMLVMIVQLCVFKITPAVRRRLTYLGLFWAFLDIVWICVFTIVYLMGAI